MTIDIFKAQPAYTGHEVADLRISATEPFPCFETKIGETVPDCLRRARTLHFEQAEALFRTLNSSLPGGTMDALFAVMARERAGYFVVPYYVGEDAVSKDAQPALCDSEGGQID